MSAWRSIAVGSLTLVALQVFTSSQGPERGGALLVWVSTLLEKAISPKVAAIPTAGKAKASTSTTPKTTTPKTTTGTPASGPNGLPTNPSVTVYT